MKSTSRKLTSILIATVMMLSCFLAAGDAFGNFSYQKNANNSAQSTATEVEFEKVTDGIDLTGVRIDNFNSSVLDASTLASKGETRTVIVSLNQPALSQSVKEGESVTDKISTLDGQNELARIRRSQDAFLASLSAKGISYKLVDAYSVVVNAVAIEINTAHLSAIKEISSVSSAVVSETYARPTTTVNLSSDTSDAQTNPVNIYDTGIYDTSEITNTLGYDGNGMTVAVLDTGLDYTHSAYQTMPDAEGLTKAEVKAVVSDLRATSFSANAGKAIDEDDLYLNKKVPFAYDYADCDTDVYPAYSNHGAHVAGIVGGQDDSYTDKDGHLVNQIFRGSAPNSQLVICKVFTDILDDEDIGGATSEDIIAALEDCVILGVDVINMSLGTSAGFSSIEIEGDSEGELLNRVYNSIRDAGISLITAASNDYSSGYGGAYGTNLRTNPDSGTVGSPSTFNGAMSVASINGQKAPYMIANGADAVFYEESSDANSVQNDFVEDMLDDGEQSRKFKYVVIPGIGQAVDYTSLIQSKINNIKNQGEKVIAVIKRGKTSFEEKVELAQKYADAVIVYNNVAGTVRMNLGDLEIFTPAISVSIDAGNALIKGAGSDSVGELEISRAYLAGPFMNDYSSWGSTPDLKLKPDVTAHGGEITSTIPGGYGEQSGTSMASPNLAGLTALVRQHVQALYPSYNKVEVTTLTNQLIMSTAETVYNELHLPYSPRKQGSGLATVDNIFSTKAYLYNSDAEDNRPKAELGADSEKKGEYEITFSVKNFGDSELKFKTQSIFFTETLAVGGLAVAERAYMLDDIPAIWKLNGNDIDEGSEFTVAAGGEAELTVKLTLSAQEKNYINTSFPNGMFVEGFLKLNSATEGQCNLTLPYMGFFGDWESAPMLDYDCYEIADFEKDTSLDEDEKPQASVWATQAFAMYYNNKYVIPMGGYVYLQDENADQIYTNRDYAAFSRFNEYYGEGDTQNYMTTTGLKALYAGLLRNAELVTYDLINATTGELVLSDEIYRVNKAYAAGGRSTPAQVLLEETPESLGLVANGKYEMNFRFYRTAADRDDPNKQNDDNTFNMTFYVDYDAPVLTDTRIRFYDYKDGNKSKQRIYLDLDIYDNHYPQAIMLCYAEDASKGLGDEDLVLKLATEYVTPIYNPVKNGTTTVSIDITDLYDKYNGRLYAQIDDYALNHSVYSLNIASAQINGLPDEFEIAEGEEITIGVNEAKKLTLNFDGDKNASNFKWTSSRESIVKVKNGEIFGAREGEALVTVTDGKTNQTIKVKVVDKGKKLTLPSISFGMIENNDLSLVKAAGAVPVNAGQTFTLEVVIDPWYYPEDELTLKWTSTNELVASVDQNGRVTTHNKRGTAVIKAVIVDGTKETAYSTSVVLNVQDPFRIDSMTLEKYYGSEEVVVIPDDKNVMYIGEEAFTDNLSVRKVIIPKTVVNINERAFKDCPNLEEIYFISETKIEPADADIAIIYRYAFQNCNKLRKIDFSNAKVVTIDAYAFTGCTALNEIVDMKKLAKIDAYAFTGCTALESIDISNLHTAGYGAFANCSSLSSISTGVNTVMSEYMFAGCTDITALTLNCSYIPAGAFSDCTALSSVTFAGEGQEIVIGEGAFRNCSNLSSVSFGNNTVKSIASNAFTGTALTSIDIQNSSTVFGSNIGTVVNYGTDYTIEVDGTVYKGTTLVKVPVTVDSAWTIKPGTVEIAPYAFEGVALPTGYGLVIPDSVTTIGEGAFAEISADAAFVWGSGVTVIPENAFKGADLSTVAFNLPEDLTEIGANAFINFDAQKINIPSSALKTVGNRAFFGATVEEIIFNTAATVSFGNGVFASCANIEEINLPVVEKAGSGLFTNTPALTTVAYAAGSKETGESAFDTYYYDYFTGAVREYSSSLSSVTLNGAEVSTLAFRGTGISEIDLTGVDTVGVGAFADCTSLSTVTALDEVINILDGAFMNCTAINGLNLTAARYIGTQAFMIEGNGGYSLVSMPAVEYIGDFAFYGGNATAINIPQTTAYIGKGAFANGKSLTSFTVSEDNESYFLSGGAIYRRAESGYELVAYPSAKHAEIKDGAKTFTVLEGTVEIGAYAFANLKTTVVNAGTGERVGVITKIILPWTLKAIGDSAFFGAYISEYEFNSIAAPVLLAEARDIGLTINSVTNTNFQDYLANYTAFTAIGVDKTVSTLKIYYPTNGTGYDNFTYSTFFGIKAQLGILMTDATRSLKAQIEGFETPETVASWANSSFAVNADNKATVQAFSDAVKAAHASYNNISKDADQLALLGEENEQKLFDIEKELKAVKARFGIAVKVSSLTLDKSSTHKTEYKSGEKFNINGLKIIVTYDDYSSESADMSNITLADADKALTVYDRYVTVEGYGKSLRVAIKVTESTADDNQTINAFNPLVIIIPVIAVVVLGGGAVAVIFILKAKKAKLKVSESEPQEKEEIVTGDEDEK